MKKVHQYGTAVLQPDGIYKLRMKDVAPFQKRFAEHIGRGRKEVEIEYTINEIEIPKTNRQLRFWKGVLCQIAIQGFRNVGYQVENRDDAEYLLKLSLGFSEEIQLTTGEFVPKVKSIRDCSKEELSDLIDEGRQFIIEELGEYVMTPEEYAEQV